MICTMPEPNRPSFEGAFEAFNRRMMQLLTYATTVAPSVKDDPALLPELADSLVVLAVARLEGFFMTLVSIGTQHREQVVRRHFYYKRKFKEALTCDRPTLIKLARSRVSFEGKRLDNLFRLLFDCSVWPSDEVRDGVHDLVLLRNLIVHREGSDWSQDGVVPADTLLSSDGPMSSRSVAMGSSRFIRSTITVRLSL
jgi:hypothetical protein